MAKKKRTTKRGFQKKIKKIQARRKKPKWTLEDGITFSALSSYLECPEQFSLKYIEGLTPKSISVPLEFGTIIHLCLEHQFLNSSPQEAVRKVTNAYRNYRKSNLSSTAERESLEVLLGFAEIVFPEYCKYWSKEDSKIEWIQREEKFDVPYVVNTPEGPRNIRLRGMRDGVFRIGGELGVFETKTRGQIKEDDIRDGLKADMQTLLYVFSTFLQRGEYPTSILYNIIKRPSTYRRKDEQLVTYLSRVKEVVKKNPEKHFMRWDVTLLQSDITQFVDRTLNPLLVDFIHWWDSVKKNPLDRFQSPYHRLNCNALIGKYGRSDMWEAIHGSRKRYAVRSVPFQELEECFQIS